MKILFYEDDESAIQGIIDFCDDEGYQYEHKSFDDGFSYIEEYDPDILILDLKDDEKEGFEGCGILDKAWEYHFRPTCVFSGQIVQSTVDQEKYKSPLVSFINKGDDNPVKAFIKKISDYSDCIKDVRKETNKAMRKSFDFFDMAMNDGIMDSKVITSLCANRIKSYFENENENIQLPIWAQYIYPVINDSFSTGDIIMLKNATEATAIQKKFFVILSQSCDIAHGKISQILVAKCYSIECFLRKKHIDNGQYEMRTKEELKTILNAGFFNEYFPLPKIDGVLPDVVVNMKNLALIHKDELSSKYVKVASLNTPYKERLVWAYMQTACRPGVPDLSVEAWANNLVVEDNELETVEICGQ